VYTLVLAGTNPTGGYGSWKLLSHGRESELESHKVLSMPRGPTAQREQEGTTEGALPATSQEDVQAPLIRNALAPSPQQLPAETTTPVSQVSPCQLLPGLVQREQQVGSAERALAQAFSQEDLRVPFVEKAAAPSPQKHEAPVVQGLSPVAQASSNAVDPIRGQSTRSIRGVASQRFTYEVKGQPTIYSLVECFHKLIPGLVACEDQREHKQREFLVMMSSTDGTIEKWPRPLKEYPRVYKAGNKNDSDSPTFMEAMNGEHGEEYGEAISIAMPALQKETRWDMMLRSQVPRGASMLPMIWVYKLKRFPDERTRKFKTRLVCVRRYKQIEAIDYPDNIARLKKKFDLTVEEAQGQDQDIFAYLGVKVQVTKCSREMTYLQKGLIDKVLRVTGMQDCNVKPIPAYTTPPLGNDAGDPRCQQSWNNASVLTMLMHLASNSMQDIQYTVYHCVRFTYNAERASHEQAILRTCRYLKGTQGKGQVFKPKAELVLNYYVDAEFTGYWKDGNELDPVCVKSKLKTSYVLLPGGCPLTWVPRLQTAGIA